MLSINKGSYKIVRGSRYGHRRMEEYFIIQPMYRLKKILNMYTSFLYIFSIYAHMCLSSLDVSSMSPDSYFCRRGVGPFLDTQSVCQCQNLTEVLIWTYAKTNDVRSGNMHNTRIVCRCLWSKCFDNLKKKTATFNVRYRRMERSETRAQHRATIVIGYRSRYRRDMCIHYEIIIKCVLFSTLKPEPN